MLTFIYALHLKETEPPQYNSLFFHIFNIKQ